MSDSSPTSPRHASEVSAKRRAILAGAHAEFARDGYARASVDAIAAVAGVSTRTIYNHFQGKAQLFEAVIQESASRVADAKIAVIDRHLSHTTDLVADLVAFGRAWAAPMPDYADHFALVRQIDAESRHIPPAAIRAWQEAGPLRVRRALARHLARLGDDGLLRASDPERAALHLLLLVTVTGYADHGEVLSEDDVGVRVTAAIRVFLHGYARPD